VNSFHTTPRSISAQSVAWLLLLMLIGLGAIGWLAWRRIPDVAYMLNNYEALTGWAAILAGWPVWTLAGVVMAILGALLGIWAGDNAKTRDAKAYMARAERRVAEYRDIADNAEADAQAALSEKMRNAEQAEQQARKQIASVKGQREAAKDEALRAHKRAAALEHQVAELTMQRDRAISTTHRRKKRIQQLEAELRSS